MRGSVIGSNERKNMESPHRRLSAVQQRGIPSLPSPKAPVVWGRGRGVINHPEKGEIWSGWGEQDDCRHPQ